MLCSAETHILGPEIQARSYRSYCKIFLHPTFTERNVRLTAWEHVQGGQRRVVHNHRGFAPAQCSRDIMGMVQHTREQVMVQRGQRGAVWWDFGTDWYQPFSKADEGQRCSFQEARSLLLTALHAPPPMTLSKVSPLTIRLRKIPFVF